jgi:hypothetical protein
MRYVCTVEAPIELQEGVQVEFANELEVSLSCPVCERGGRTVIMFTDEERSYCTPTKHPFPGHIISTEFLVPEHVMPRIWYRKRHIAIARYHIEYEFHPFTDPQDFLVNIWRRPTWARVSFTITCPCGQTKDESTQNNLGRPFVITCPACGNPLYYEKQTIPRFIGMKKKK